MNSSYIDELESVAAIDLPWNSLQGKTIAVTGSTGLICSFMVDLIMYRNKKYNNDCKVIAVTRNAQKAEIRFKGHLKNDLFSILEHDISEPLPDLHIDYLIHGASNADPISFVKDPVGTMKSNVLGTINLLEYAKINPSSRVLFLSSGEVYGESSEITEFTEEDCGYINFNDLRATYPTSKRTAEQLCLSYAQQFHIDVLISRLCYVYGPTMTDTDSRVIAQFLRNVLDNKDIIMKSEGLQIRSYCYLTDAVSALLHILLLGDIGGIYNVANKTSNVSIRQLAEALSAQFGLPIKFEIPSMAEKSGYSKVTRAILNAAKLEGLGWNARVEIHEGLGRTVRVLRENRFDF
jgi:nucleoside-diphosphate-sugar epimerase